MIICVFEIILTTLSVCQFVQDSFMLAFGSLSLLPLHPIPRLLPFRRPNRLSSRLPVLIQASTLFVSVSLVLSGRCSQLFDSLLEIGAAWL